MTTIECNMLQRTIFTADRPTWLRFVLVAAFVAAESLLVAAQPPSDPPMAPLAAPISSRKSRTAKVVEQNAVSRESLQAALKRLKQANADLKEYASTMNPPEEIDPEIVTPSLDPANPELDATEDGVDAVDAGTEARPIAGLTRELDDLKQQQAKRVVRIKSQLMKLRRMRQEQIAAEAKAAELLANAPKSDGDGHGSEDHGAPSEHADSPEQDPKIEDPHENGAEHAHRGSSKPPKPAAHEPDHSHPETPHETPHNPSESPEDPSEPPLMSDIVMMSPKAVDRLELANSLFAMGRTESALAVYGQIEQAGLSEEDRIWLDYQMASCQRRLGNVAEAEKMYRRVVAANPDSTWSKYSRWWLDLLRDRNKVQTELSQLQDVIKTYKTSLEAKSDNKSTP